MFGSQDNHFTFYIAGAVRRKEFRKDRLHILEDIQRRQEDKRQQKERKDRNALEKKIKKMAVDDLEEVFPDLAPEAYATMRSLLSGDAIGLEFTHMWDTEGTTKPYRGHILKKKRSRKIIHYTIGYWELDQSEEDCEDWILRATELAADLVNGDFIL